MLTVIAYSVLAIALLTVFLAVRIHPYWYWLSAFSMYIFSVLGMLTIGVFTLSLSIILLVLAIAHSLKLIKNKFHTFIAIVVGFLLWVVTYLSFLLGFNIFAPVLWIIR